MTTTTKSICVQRNLQGIENYLILTYPVYPLSSPKAKITHGAITKHKSKERILNV